MFFYSRNLPPTDVHAIKRLRAIITTLPIQPIHETPRSLTIEKLLGCPFDFSLALLCVVLRFMQSTHLFVVQTDWSFLSSSLSASLPFAHSLARYDSPDPGNSAKWLLDTIFRDVLSLSLDRTLLTTASCYNLRANCVHSAKLIQIKPDCGQITPFVIVTIYLEII